MLREVAEYPNSFSPLGENEERIETERYTLCIGAGSTWNTVQRQRFPLEEVDEVLAEVRDALRERGRKQTQWEVGSSAPDGLVDALLERGLEPDKDPYAVALVLTREPPAIAPELTAREIESLEEMEAARRLARRRDRLHRHGCGDRARIAPLRRRYEGRCAGPRRLPCADPGTLGRCRRARDAGADHAGRLDVAADPGAARLRAGRRGAHADRSLRLSAHCPLPRHAEGEGGISTSIYRRLPGAAAEEREVWER